MTLLTAQNFKEKAIPLENVSSLDKLLEAAGNKRLVMLGEASHGHCLPPTPAYVAAYVHAGLRWPDAGWHVLALVSHECARKRYETLV